MAKFKQMNNYINATLAALIENQNLCKLLKYPSDNPFAESDIEDASALIFKNIFPVPKIPSVTTEAMSMLSVFFDFFKLSPEKGTKEGTILFNIIVHNDLWRMTDAEELRPYSILHEIDEIFNNKNIIGIKKVQFDRIKYLYFNENYSGYQASYIVTSVN